MTPFLSLSLSLFTYERPHPLSESTFTAEITDPVRVQGRLRRLPSSSLSPLLGRASYEIFPRRMIFLISTGTAGLSFLSRPTTFLRDQKRSWRASVCIAKGPRLSRYPFPLPLAFRLLALFYRRYASPFPFRSRLFLTDEAASRYNGLSFRRFKKILFFLFF